MNRTYITGDVHGETDFNKLHCFFQLNKDLDRSDVMIIAGDAGFIFRNNPCNETELRIKTRIENSGCTCFVVLGNHENYERIELLPTKNCFGGKVHFEEKFPNIVYAINGYVYEINGKSFWTFSGAVSTDKDNRTPYISWWPQEVPSYKDMEKGINSLYDYGKVDYIITHTGPACLTAQLSNYIMEDPVSNYLDIIYDTKMFNKWYFGHFHKDKNITKNVKVLYNTIELLD